MPEAWYARVEFDELLDPSIEDLVANVDAMGVPDGTFTGTLKNTQPATLKCDSATGAGQVDVPYDGYYSPAGDKISYPLGPSLVFIPDDPTVIATSSSCTLTLKENITDKEGNQVPADQRGPYTWKVGEITVLAIDPTTDDSKQDPVAAGVDITFNTGVTKASINATDMATGDSTVYNFTPALPNPYAFEESPEEWFFGADFPVSGGPYTFKFLQGAKLIDQCGKSQTLGAPSVDDQTQTTLTTNALKLSGIAGATEPGAKVVITFNQYMDPDSIDLAADISVKDAAGNTPTNLRIEPDASLTKTVVYADYKLGTMYTFTLKNGATIDDCPGGESSFVVGPGDTCVKSTTYMSPMDQVTTFTTASAITLKSISPKDNASESVAASAAGITLTFNQEMDPASFVQGTDFTISPNVPLTVANIGGPLSGSYEQINLFPSAAAGTFPPGTYTFTLLKAGSESDFITPADTFSPSADQVIHFTVTPNGAAHVCL